jgi:hypothetical protein
MENIRHGRVVNNDSLLNIPVQQRQILNVVPVVEYTVLAEKPITYCLQDRINREMNFEKFSTKAETTL